jgi:hypothetical protein
VLRVTVLSVLVGGAIVAWAAIANPMIQLPPWWQMLAALPTIYAYLLIMLLAHLAIPAGVQVRKDLIHVNHGQSNWVVKSDAIRSTRIVVFAPDRIRLRVFYLYKGKLRTRTIGIGRRVDLDSLVVALPVYPDIWDARHRYACLRNAKWNAETNSALRFDAESNGRFGNLSWKDV